jgi:hypothetical protein
MDSTSQSSGVEGSEHTVFARQNQGDTINRNHMNMKSRHQLQNTDHETILSIPEKSA